MQYRQLGRSGLKVSPICLGTMMFGGPTDEAASARIVAKAREAGVNFIDTADAYNKGGSEQVVGRALHTLIGYTDQPTAMQLTVYLAILLITFVLMRFVGSPVKVAQPART